MKTKESILLCRKLVKAREDAKLTQKEVSNYKIVSQSELSKIENGQRVVSFILLEKLAELYSKELTFFKIIEK